MKTHIKVKESQAYFDIAKALKALGNNDILVGIPENKGTRESIAGNNTLSNAFLGYIHEHGVPEKNIPARPHLVPGIEDARKDIIKLLKEAGVAAFEGKIHIVENKQNQIGTLCQNAVKARFVNNSWQPLSEKTLNNKALKKDDAGNVMTNKKGIAKREKSRLEKGRPNPLVDTGELSNSYTYVIRERK